MPPFEVTLKKTDLGFYWSRPNGIVRSITFGGPFRDRGECLWNASQKLGTSDIALIDTATVTGTDSDVAVAVS